MGNNVNAVEKDSLDGVLPGPERQRIIAQRPKIGIEHESRTTFRRNRGLAVDRQTGTSSASGKTLTFDAYLANTPTL
jgi:hypothetical protein